MFRIKNRFFIKGLIFGALVSFCTTLLFMLASQVWAGGITSFWGESWLYVSTIIPFSITFIVLGQYFQNRKDVSNKKLWLISLLSAFVVTLYSGTIGAIFGEWVAGGGRLVIPIDGGYRSVNIEGILFSGTVYAFVLLPLTIPYARFLIGIFYKINKK